MLNSRLNKPSSTQRTAQYIMSGESKIFREEWDINAGMILTSTM